MKKSLIFGLATAALVGGIFVACGSGEISSISEEESTVMSLALSNSSVYTPEEVAKALAACSTDVNCSKKMNSTPDVVVSSSSKSDVTEPSSSSAETAKSSSSATTPVSSSSLVIDFSSSSSEIVLPSSSSIAGTEDGSVNGTCAPVPATINKGESTTWTFTQTQPCGISCLTIGNAAAYEWTLTDGTAASTSGTGLKKVVTTYANSGSYGASLVVDGNSVTCSDLQVNGAAITGCSCTAASTTVDVATSGAASWTVSGCTSAGAEITGYTWTGATGSGLSATATLSAKGDSISPVVTVSNDDNTKQEFTCETVKATDSSSPDYEITDQNKAIVLPAGESTVIMNLAADWHNGTAGTCTIACNGDGNLSGTIGGVELSGSYYGTVSIPIASTINGTALLFNLGGPYSCSVGW